MQYIKANVNYLLGPLPYTKMRITGISPTETIWIKVPPNEDHIVMENDLLSFAPYPTAGALLLNKYQGNVSELHNKGVLMIHPEWWNDMNERGQLDNDGNYIGPSSYPL